MLKCEEQQAVGIKQSAAEASRAARRGPAFCLVLAAFCLLFVSSCRVDMQDQPRMKPYRSSTFYKDGLSSRQLVPGTVPRGWLRDDKEFFTGKKSSSTTTTPSQNSGSGAVTPAPTATAGAAQIAAAYPDDIDKFPFPITKQMLDERGQERYEIFCSVCHGLTGEGDGMIVRRGFRTPPSFYDANLRQAPVGHFFDVVSNGWGAMPAYAAQIPVQDRWLIIAYVRALQRTRPAPVAVTPPPSAKPTAGGQK